LVVHKGQAAAPRVFNVLNGEAVQTRSTAFGVVGTLFSDEGIELVWVSKGDEDVDPDWFSSDEVDLIVVVRGGLKFEFESSDLSERVLAPGDVLVLPSNTRCRAYRWPRECKEATIFLAASRTGSDLRAKPSSARLIAKQAFR
jgi:hypothetical protein